MNNIKSVFSVKDLENLSGIKAHTIRIWEKRYAIFSPDRIENNVRCYNSEDLKKVLNIAFLNNFGYKISKIAALGELEIKELVNQIYSDKTDASFAIAQFKLAMFKFDAQLFQNTYDQLAQNKSFEAIFFDVFLPLLEEIGLLWQTETLKPIHEHFISSLLRQKLFTEIELQQKKVDKETSEIFVLFLPQQEIHELGILFVNYLLLKQNKHVIFLGDNVLVDDLKEIVKLFDKVVFVSYFTVQPEPEKIDEYLAHFSDFILSHSMNEFWVLGKQAKFSNMTFKNIRTFSGIQEMMLLL